MQLLEIREKYFQSKDVLIKTGILRMQTICDPWVNTILVLPGPGTFRFWAALTDL
jgi:hypothetical protein